MCPSDEGLGPKPQGPKSQAQGFHFGLTQFLCLSPNPWNQKVPCHFTLKKDLKAKEELWKFKIFHHAKIYI